MTIRLLAILLVGMALSAFMPGHAQTADKTTKTDKEAEKLTADNPIVGTYISKFVIDTISGPGFEAGLPCSVLRDDPNVPVTFCESAQMTALMSGGTLLVLENNASGTPTTSAAGNWQANTESTYQARTIAIQYNPDGTVFRFNVVDSRSEAKPGFVGTTGTFESRSYLPSQDPQDPNEPYLFKNVGTFETFRVE